MEKRDVIEEFMEEVKKVPQEHPSNPMRVQNGKKFSHSKAVQPHNYRLYFDFTKASYNPTQPYLSKNYNSEDHYTFPTHRIVVRKSSVEVCYLAHKKQWRRIMAESEEEITERINEIDLEIQDRCFSYVKDFISKNGGKSEFKLLRKRKQDWGIHGDDFLDNIPDEYIINDTVFKKVYRDKVEFTGVNEVKNYISNRALERFSPIISKALYNLADRIQPKDRLLEIKKKIKEVKDVFRLSGEISLLNDSERYELSNWLIELEG